MNRRNFIKLAAAAGAFAMSPFKPKAPPPKVIAARFDDLFAPLRGRSFWIPTTIRPKEWYASIGSAEAEAVYGPEHSMGNLARTLIKESY